MSNRNCHPTQRIVDGELVAIQETETITVEVGGVLNLEEICTTCGALVTLCPLEIGPAQRVFTELIPEGMLFQQRF